jgi:2-succinyl-5-enolpyruvyl-6-hydroxy-3-cyclohexene-1-carboxylate synthase
VSVPSGAGGASSASVQATFAATLVDEWVRAGITDAVVCPGSRSTPLALALARCGDIALHVRLDERGAGFFAVGLGLATGRPALVCTTSGTAAAELHPAVVEAHHNRVPLIACTADRPPELHETGAPQTIDQRDLFGPVTRWRADPGVAVSEAAESWRALAARAAFEALEGPSGPGPVHLNLAFRDPLVGEPGELPAGRPHGARYYRVSSGQPSAGVGTGTWCSEVAGWSGRPGIVVAGARCGPPEAVVSVAERLGWPLLADPRSGCRIAHPNVVAAADAILREPRSRAALLPEVVVVLGDPWASKSLATHIAAASGSGARVVVVDPWWRWVDPDRVVTEFCRADPASWLVDVQALLTAPAPRDWLARWRAAESAAQEAIDAVLAEDAGAHRGRATEPGLARRILGIVPHDARVVVSSSMPVRDLEWYAPAMADPPQVLANRGVNGIDGVSSTAQGVAAGGPGPVIGLLGDLAFLHDSSSLVRSAGTPAIGTTALVVVDNGGGGIFDFLPQSKAMDRARFELLFGTPQMADVADVARGFGLWVTDAGTPAEMEEGVRAAVTQGGLSVVRVRVVTRSGNAELHERFHAATGAAVREVLG